MKNETEVLTDLKKGIYNLSFLKTLVIYIRQCLWNIPKNVLNEYTSPDIRLFKEKQEIGDGIECFGGGCPQKAHGLCWGALAISRRSDSSLFNKKWKWRKKMGLQNIAKSSFFTYEHRNITLQVTIHPVKLKLPLTSLLSLYNQQVAS